MSMSYVDELHNAKPDPVQHCLLDVVVLDKEETGGSRDRHGRCQFSLLLSGIVSIDWLF